MWDVSQIEALCRAKTMYNFTQFVRRMFRFLYSLVTIQPSCCNPHHANKYQKSGQTFCFSSFTRRQQYSRSAVTHTTLISTKKADKRSSQQITSSASRTIYSQWTNDRSNIMIVYRTDFSSIIVE